MLSMDILTLLSESTSLSHYANNLFGVLNVYFLQLLLTRLTPVVKTPSAHF